MSMSTHVLGFRPPDEKFQQMKAVYDACQAAGVEVPDDVQNFFEYGPPDDAGVQLDLQRDSEAVHEWRDESCEGYEVDLRKLPQGIHIIRFENCY